MKKIIIPIVAILLSTHIFSQSKPDSVAVLEVAAFGYVGSWFRADSAGMRKALHPELVKYRVTSASSVDIATPDGLVRGAHSRPPQSYEGVDLQYGLLDISGNIAAVIVTNNIFWDLVFLTKHDTTWLVANVAWDLSSVSDEGTVEEIAKTAMDYIIAIYSGNDNILSNILHPEVDIRRPISATEVDKVGFDWIIEKCKNNSFANSEFDPESVEIEVLSKYKSYASVKIYSNLGIEYMHMRYVNQNWYIVNGLWKRNSYEITDVGEALEIPVGFELQQNYPNPFNPTTTINYSVPNVGDANFASPTQVLLVVYDIQGNEIVTLVDEYKSSGVY